MKFCHVQDPEELLLWDQKVIGDNIIKFVIQCCKEGRAQHSIHAYYASIKHFYEMNDVVLNWKKLKKFVSKANGKRALDRPYTYKEIKQLLDRADPRMRVVILLMVSGGLRIGAIPDLRVGDFVE
jgi:integrase